MLTLHYAPDNASLIVRMVLDELGLPFDTRLVDRSTRQQDSEAFRALNPAGLIPVLETPEGPLSETAAILLWLSERQGRMAPSPGDSQRGPFLRALFFASNTLHADLRQVFYPAQYVDTDAQAQKRLHDTVTARVHRHVGVLEGLAKAGVPWLGAPEPSVLDFYVAPILRWAQIYGGVAQGWFDLAGFPRLRAMALGLETRPSVIRAARVEGLGAALFTAPGPCNPPEGSALG
jgi:glutathione S-transferase